MKEYFEERRLEGNIKINIGEKGYWKGSKLSIVEDCIQIVENYQKQGYKLTLRQLYYQLVSRDLIPNHDKVYKKLSSILDDIRYSGLIDWDAIEDRGRIPYIPYYVHGIEDAIKDTIKHYRLDRQIGQETIVEVWTEKDAISGILKRVTSEYHIRLVVNKGYSSSTAMHKAYQRFVGHINKGKKVIVLYFGDHDPSGLDMVRDIKDRIELFLSKGSLLSESLIESWWENNKKTVYDILDFKPSYESLIEGLMSPDREPTDKEELEWVEAQKRLFLYDNNSFSIQQIGLTKEQINQYNPPPNPAKITDPRARWYIAEHGNVSYEVDALEPSVMEEIVESAIERVIDIDIYNKARSNEWGQIKELMKIAKEYR